MKVNIREVLREMQNYTIDGFDIEKLMQRCIRQDIHKNLKIYLEDNELIEQDTIANSVKATVDALVKKYDTIDNARLHHEWKSIYGSVRINSHDEKMTEFYLEAHSSSYLVFMLRYAINGFFDQDYQETNSFKDSQGIGYDTRTGSYALQNITFTMFKNGKVKAKGLTEDQYERILEGFDNYYKYTFGVTNYISNSLKSGDKK